MAIEGAIPFAYLTGLMRPCDGLLAVDAGDAYFASITRSSMLSTQSITQLGKQRVMGRKSQIIHIYPIGFPFATSGAYCDK